MPQILFLSHRIPFPPDRGDKIRSHHILKALAQIAPVHVGTFADDALDRAGEPDLAAIARSFHVQPRTKPLVLAGAQALASGAAVSRTAFHSKPLARWIDATLNAHPIRAIYVFSGQMGHYVPSGFAGRVIADFVDVDSAKFEAYARKKGAFAGWIDAREARLLREDEAALARRADVSLLITHQEADLFASRLPDAERLACDVRVLGNGIDSGFFDPAQCVPEPRMAAVNGPKLIFTGQMDYAPNVDAVVRMARCILPLIRRAMPRASFHIVGRCPGAEVRALDTLDGCTVWGRVDDVRTWLAASDLAVAPLGIARGVQNKVLEAMAMQLPVVLTPQAATGIDALDGRDFAIAQSDEAMAEAAVRLLKDREGARRMGESARAFVVGRKSWQAELAGLPALIDAMGTARHAA